MQAQMDMSNDALMALVSEIQTEIEQSETLVVTEAASVVDEVVDIDAFPSEEQLISSSVEMAELDDDLLQSLVADIQRKQAYDSQDSTLNIGTDTKTDTKHEVAKTESKVAKTPKTPKAAKTATLRVTKNLADIDDSVFQLVTADTAPFKADVLSKKPAQVKIAEKFDNLFHSIADGKLPSRYVVMAFQHLSKHGTATSGDLIGMMKAVSLGAGTAGSQVGQIMTLFAVTKIADRVGNTLTLRADSILAMKLQDILNKS